MLAPDVVPQGAAPILAGMGITTHGSLTVQNASYNGNGDKIIGFTRLVSIVAGLVLKGEMYEQLKHHN